MATPPPAVQKAMDLAAELCGSISFTNTTQTRRAMRRAILAVLRRTHPALSERVLGEAMENAYINRRTDVYEAAVAELMRYAAPGSLPETWRKPVRALFRPAGALNRWQQARVDRACDIVEAVHLEFKRPHLIQ